MRSKDYFIGKRIAVIGVGAGGEMLADIKALVKANALVSVYDLRSEGRLLEHIATLRSLGLANLVLGQIPADDLLDMDMIVLSRDYPKDSSFLAGARERGIEIEHPEGLFLRLVPPVTVVGVIGDYGTSTVVSMLSPMLERASVAAGQRFAEIDWESGTGVLSHLKKLSTGDVVLMRMGGALAAEIASLDWSPQIAVFTTAPSPRSYRESPFEIVANQTYTGCIVGSDEVIDALRLSGIQTRSKMLRTKVSIVPEGWLSENARLHNMESAALALQTARILKVSDEDARQTLSSWKPLKGRLESLKKIRGIEIINDAASVDPYSTSVALGSVSKGKNVILIFGGRDCGSDCRDLYAAIRKHAHTVVVLPGSGTLKERRSIHRIEGVEAVSVPSIEEAVRCAVDRAKKGDVILYSPAFAVGGVDASRKERSQRFLKAIRSL